MIFIRVAREAPLRRWRLNKDLRREVREQAMEIMAFRQRGVRAHRALGRACIAGSRRSLE